MAVDDDDPVKAEYDVFITPKLAQDIYLLQYPNRERKYPYNERQGTKPTELRIKPKSGFIEVDIPLNVHDRFDKAKGTRWGNDLRKSKESGPESFGLSSGFIQYSNTTSGSHRSGRAEQVDEDSDQEMETLKRGLFRESNDLGLVLNKQTLGGQIVHDEAGKPLYMLGAFRQSESPARERHDYANTLVRSAAPFEGYGGGSNARSISPHRRSTSTGLCKASQGKRSSRTSSYDRASCCTDDHQSSC